MDNSELAMDSSEDSGHEEEFKIVSVCKKQVEENEYNYDAHVKLIQALRKSGELEELRKAHLSMNKIYPLSPELWIAWLSDEQKICCTEEERGFVIGLFNKSVQEYMSVQVWVEYIMFMLGGGKMEETRRVCEEALTAVGVHLAEGILVWQAVILVEQQFMLSLSPDDKEAEEQKKRIHNLYRRQARVPLMNCNKEEFISEAAKWFDDGLDPHMQRDLEKSYKKTMERLPFEETLIRANDDTEKLEAYRKYIDFVRKVDNPVHIQNIYERTVTDLCLNAGIWEEYVRFVMDQFSSASYVILPVCDRSQLNCPWSSSLFDLHITALLLFSPQIEEENIKVRIEGALNRSLNCGVLNEVVNIWMSYLVYLRRRINLTEQTENADLEIFRKCCDQAIAFIDAKLGEDFDEESRIARYRSRFEAETVRDMEMARLIWNEHIMKRNNNFKSSSLWLEFIHLERHFGTEKHCRKLYRRALERVWDGVEEIGASFLQFEQQLGTLESMMDFERRYRDRLSIVHKRRMVENMKEENMKEQEMQKKTYRGKSKNYQSGNILKSQDNKMYQKVKDEPLSPSQPKALKRSGSELESTASPHKKMCSEKNEIKKEPADDYKKGHGEFIPHDSSLDYRSVFLSNMDYNANEEDIVAIFKDCGTVENFRVTKDFKGRSKGFGYLVFKEADAVSLALAKDRTPIGIRPLFISRCNPKNREPAFKFKNQIEREKLFVKGLPLSMNEADVRAAFEPNAQIKSMRLITNRNGYSKGNCYIEYHDADAAEAVRAQMDGAVLKDHKITVLISNPSASVSNRTKTGTFNSFLRPSSRQSDTKKPKLSLLPRSLQRKPEPSTQNADRPTSSSSDANSSTNGLHDTNRKSNEDFRKMFLK